MESIYRDSVRRNMTSLQQGELGKQGGFLKLQHHCLGVIGFVVSYRTAVLRVKAVMRNTFGVLPGVAPVQDRSWGGYD